MVKPAPCLAPYDCTFLLARFTAAWRKLLGEQGSPVTGRHI
jgi:hypothetical protein